MGRIRWFSLAVLALSACGSRSATTTTVSPTAPAPLQDQVAISGLPDRPDFLIRGSYDLSATLTRADGSPPEPCRSTAIWSSDNRTVARMVTPETDSHPATEPGPVMEIGDEGEATITATCAGVSGQRHVRVSHFDLRGTVRSADGQPLSGALVRVRSRFFLDAWTTVATTGPDGSYVVPSRIPDGTVEFSRPGFSLVSVPLKWNLETTVTADGTLEPTSGTIAQGSGRLCNVLSTQPGYAECESAGVHLRDAAVAFRATRNGTIFIRVQFPGGTGMTGSFVASLGCDGHTVFSYGEADGAGVGYAYDANTGCHYLLALANTTSARILPYTYTIEFR
jgi:hypothetical protein